MAKQRQDWKDRGEEFAVQAADAAITRLEGEIQEKLDRLAQLDRELEEPSATLVVQKLAERSQFHREVLGLQEQLVFAREGVKPKMVQAAGRAGRTKDGKGCFG